MAKEEDGTVMKKVQDAYTLRCSPQVHGVVHDTLKFVRSILKVEMNSATDNPVCLYRSYMLTPCMVTLHACMNDCIMFYLSWYSHVKIKQCLEETFMGSTQGRYVCECMPGSTYVTQFITN